MILSPRTLCKESVKERLVLAPVLNLGQKLLTKASVTAHRVKWGLAVVIMGNRGVWF
jgi:hypothetical protein